MALLSGPPWERNLRVLWLAQLVAMIGMSACIPFLPLYVRTLGASEAEAPFWSGLIYAAPFVMSSMLTPLWGALGDRYGQKSMVVRAIAGLAVSMTLMGFATNVWWLLILRVFQGAVSGFVASNNAFVSATTPTEHVGKSLATLQTSIAAGSVLGPFLGGAISDAYGAEYVFYAVGILCLASMAIIIRFITEEPRGTKPGQTRVVAGMRIAMRDSDLRLLLLIVLITQAALVIPQPIVPYYIQELGAPQRWLSTITGVIVSMVGVCSIVSSRWWGARSDRLGYQPTMRTASLIVLGGMLAQAFVPSWEWLFPVRTVIGLASGALIPLVYGELARRSPMGRKGGIMGIASSATLMGNLLGPLLCSAIAPWIPLPWVFVTSAVVMGVALGMSRWLRAPQSA